MANRGILPMATLAALLLGSGCVNTSMTSQVNRVALPQPLMRILVVGNFADLAFRDRAETRLCDDIASKSSAQCFRSLDYTPPGTFTTADLTAAIQAVGADGALILAATGTSIATAYIPQSSTTSGSASVVGNTIYGQSTTQTYGGFNVSKPVAGFEVVLYSDRDANPVWYATAGAGGNAFHDWDDLVSATAGRTVTKLLEDRVLGARRR